MNSQKIKPLHVPIEFFRAAPAQVSFVIDPPVTPKARHPNRILICISTEVRPLIIRIRKGIPDEIFLQLPWHRKIHTIFARISFPGKQFPARDLSLGIPTAVTCITEGIDIILEFFCDRRIDFEFNVKLCCIPHAEPPHAADEKKNPVLDHSDTGLQIITGTAEYSKSSDSPGTER
ncbi:MAG: hypothetical protein IJM63_01140 [Solobacterium sp.]|nr:hypothetical protein [Solobacterium sp.]